MGLRACLVIGVLALAACSGPLKLLTGGGPNVAANVQAGKTNAQTIGETRVTEQKLVRPQARTINQSSGDSRVRAEKVGSVVVQERVPTWIWVAMVIAWVLDSPARWPGQIWRAVRRQP